MALEKLQPKEVFSFFEEICSIPHGSGNVKKISDYLVSFAKERNLEVIQDEALNVIIKAPGTAGYEAKEPIILQGHMDMVAVKEPDADIDMEKDGLKVKTDGEYVFAEGTSLGGDDGIAVAYCLALLDSNDIPHPPLEVVITTDEETGMNGASAIDLSSLKGKKLINIDNEEEGVFITSCAGGARVDTEIEFEKENTKGIKLHLTVSGLLGGHSGEMIIKGRGNACHILARALLEARDKCETHVVNFEGGVADNAIPFSAAADVVIREADVKAFTDSICDTAIAVKTELGLKDPDVNIFIEGIEAFSYLKEESNLCHKEEGEHEVIRDSDITRFLSMVCTMPDGVQIMSAYVEGLVETSLNLGIVRTNENSIRIEQSVRSSIESSKNHLIKKLKLIADSYGAKVSVRGVYPGWKFAEVSPLRDHMVEVYKNLYKREPYIKAIHAGLECGILCHKIDELDCISIGPDMQDIHSTAEKLSVKSTASVWDYLKEVLK